MWPFLIAKNQCLKIFGALIDGENCSVMKITAITAEAYSKSSFLHLKKCHGMDTFWTFKLQNNFDFRLVHFFDSTLNFCLLVRNKQDSMFVDSLGATINWAAVSIFRMKRIMQVATNVKIAFSILVLVEVWGSEQKSGQVLEAKQWQLRGWKSWKIAIELEELWDKLLKAT